jgi:ParB-like chromosome segregation protein Spo0J
VSALPVVAAHTPRSISAIRVVDRRRADLGDIDSLAASIRAVGLLHPIVVTADGRLIAGHRRLEACRRLGWSTVPVTVADQLHDARALLMAERDENVCRKDMTPSEKVALGRALEELERPRARARQRAGTALQPQENFSSGSRSAAERTGKVYDLVGEAVGMSGPTYKRAKAVVLAAEEGREGAAEALDQMDATGKVTPAYSQLKGGPAVASGGAGRGSRPVAPPAAVLPAGKRQTYLANAARDRIDTALNRMAGLADGLAGVDVARAVALVTPEQLAAWRSTSERVRRDLRALDAQLRGDR